MSFNNERDRLIDQHASHVHDLVAPNLDTEEVLRDLLDARGDQEVQFGIEEVEHDRQRERVEKEMKVRLRAVRVALTPLRVALQVHRDLGRDRGIYPGARGLVLLLEEGLDRVKDPGEKDLVPLLEEDLGRVIDPGARGLGPKINQEEDLVPVPLMIERKGLVVLRNQRRVNP
jgi:hypothetical protein